MMQPSILGPPPAGTSPPQAPSSSSSSPSSATAAATAAAVSFIPDRAPSFARRPPAANNNVTHRGGSHNNTAPPSQPHHHHYHHHHHHPQHTRSTGSDFIHVDRSNNRRMAAPDRGDSWIEVASQPSDSYTSSSSPEEPVITSGLQVPKRKHRARRRNSTSTAIPSSSRVVESSSEYEDDEDDEDLDGIDLNAIDSIGSSITDPSLSEGEEGSSDEEESDEDEGEIQPVAGFSHHPSVSRPQNNFRTFSRDPPQPDHDAALRASLSTLLSCAAGVGSASKPRGADRMGAIQEHIRPAPIQTLSLVTDSEREAIMSAPQPPPPPFRKTLHHPPPPPITHQQQRQQQRPASPRRSKEDSSKHKTKTRSRRSSKAVSAGVNPAVPTITASNMTYLTLAVSAGAVIIVSAISFSAGYALGKEVGRSEMLELGSSGGDIVKRAASGTVSKVGGKIVMSTGMGSGLRSITVA
ncbi:hypothetical protein AA313_de0206809 [Arthrobotrys entomopaga]|nr:hypothetical protein AA313_de0206809 [Arthrobotrys entomopaga]